MTCKIGAVSVFLLIAASSSGLAQSASTDETTGRKVETLLDAQGVAVKQDIETSSVQVTSNSAVAVESDKPFVELSIANPEIADISTITETMVYVLGKRPGNTTLMMLGEGGALMRVVDIRVVPDISEFTSRLSQLFPEQQIEAVTANDGIVLKGTVDSEAVVEQVLELASHYASGQISNLMTVKPTEEIRPDLTSFERKLRELLPEEDIAVEIRDGGILLTGEVASPNALENASKLAESFAPGRVTSFVTVREISKPLPEVSAIASALAKILPKEDIEVHLIGESIVLSGQVSSQEKLQQASDVAKMLYSDTTISNMLTVSTASPCVVRTRKGGEMTEISVPCQN